MSDLGDIADFFDHSFDCICAGTGVCDECDGTARCNFCDEYPEGQCPICKGTGDCVDCGGTADCPGRPTIN
jgi:hypothetical protein